MLKLFTERARRVMFYAQEEAGRLGENYVSTQHLLLGLVRESDSVAARILERMGISLEAIRSEIEQQVSPGEIREPKEMQLTPRAKRVIDLAYDEARKLNTKYVGTEHLLLGLIREGEGMAGRVLAKLGADLERTRREVRMLLEPQDADGAQPQAHPTSFFNFDTSPAVQQTMQLAHSEALAQGQNVVDVEHVLLGLVRLSDNKIAKIFAQFGIDEQKLKEALGRLQAGEGPDKGVEGTAN